MQRLPVMVAKTKINETVPVIVWRNGQQVSLSVEVGEQEDEEVKDKAGTKHSSDSSKIPSRSRSFSGKVTIRTVNVMV